MDNWTKNENSPHVIPNMYDVFFCETQKKIYPYTESEKHIKAYRLSLYKQKKIQYISKISAFVFHSIK